jgi:Na+/phosphate symporter
MGQQSVSVRGIEWIILNQFGRRNLPAYERAKLALLLEPIIAAKAKENQGKRTDLITENICQKSDKCSEPIDTKREVAKAAHVSHDTIAKVKKIEAKATPEQKQELKNDTVSINEIHKQIKQI